jgi:hypothetical protein
VNPLKIQWALDKLRRELVDAGVLEAGVLEDDDETLTWLELEKLHRELWA